MIKGAIFDVDGTILDTMEIWEEMGERYLHSLGIEAEPNFSEILFTMTVPEGAAYTKKRYQLKQSEEEITQGILDMIRDFYYYEAPAKEGVIDFLKGMQQHGIPMVVATSCEREHVERAFERLGILDCFAKIFTCTEVGAGKTSPLIYQTAAGYLDAKPEEVLVFEDAIHAITTASAAGFVTVAVAEAYGRQAAEEMKAHTTYYIQDWTDTDAFWDLLRK